MDEVKKEIGKWFLDIAKYVATAVVLASIFSSVNNQAAILVGGIATIAISLFTGVWMIKESSENKKQNKQKNKK